jgi:hypothetical protein
MILQSVLDGMLSAVLWLFDMLLPRALVVTVLACAAAVILIPAAWLFCRRLMARS